MKNDAMAIFLTSKKDLSPSFFSRLDFNKGEEKDKKSTIRSMLCLLCLNKIKLKKGLWSTPNFLRTLRVKLFFTLWHCGWKLSKKYNLKMILCVKIQMQLILIWKFTPGEVRLFKVIFKHCALLACRFVVMMPNWPFSWLMNVKWARAWA